jgi:hypothetical protein
MRPRRAPALLPRQLEVDPLFSETRLLLMAIIGRDRGVRLRMALPLPILLPWPVLLVGILKHPTLPALHLHAAHREMVARRAMPTPRDLHAQLPDLAPAETAKI